MLLLITSIFGSIPSLTSHSVYIHDKPFSSIDATNICKCKHLTNLYVTNSSIKLLSSRFFVKCHSLETLVISNNELTEITSDAFSDLSNLFALNLSRNHITTLPKDVFKPLINLRYLILNRNRIEMIDSNLFLHNPYLFYLDISDNSLKNIEPKSFHMLKHLFYLYIYNNPSLNSTDFLFEDLYARIIIMENCAFTQLFIPMNVIRINAEGNKINNITAHPNTELRSLTITRNNFTNFSRLPPLVNLNYLSIEYNGIDFMHLSHMNKLKELSIVLKPNQNINVTEIKESLPSLRRLDIVSSDLSDENQKQILIDSQQQFDIYINGKEYSFNRQSINQKDKVTSKLINCLRKMN